MTPVVDHLTPIPVPEPPRRPARLRDRAGRVMRRRLTRRLRPLFIALAVGLLLAGGVLVWPTRHAPSSDARSQLDSGVSTTLSSFFGPYLAARKGGSFGLDHIDVTAAKDESFPFYLTVAYPKESSSVRASNTDSDVGIGGAQLYLESTSGPVDHEFLSYMVRFPTGFQWVKGGKLPGLYGGTVDSGRKIPDGTNGLSTRYMWRAGGAGEVYAYLPTSVAHGTSLGRGSWHFPTGRWTSIEQEVQLNVPGQPNGVVNVWVDGKQVLHQTGLMFRSTTDLQIDGLFFSTFFGGGDKTWATPVAWHVDFADFRLSPTFLGNG